MALILQIYILIALIFFQTNVLCIKIENAIQTSNMANNHGHIIGYFTFTGKGVAGMTYHISPYKNSSNYKLSVYAMTFDVYSNLQRISAYYSENSCRDFYRRSMFNANINQQSGTVQLGRFSGGFSVAIVLSDKYVCPPNIKQLGVEENTDTIIHTTIELFNPEDGKFIDHLSATDRETTEILQFLVAMYMAMGIWVTYSIIHKVSVDNHMMKLIQKLTSTIVVLHVAMYLLLLVVYHRLAVKGTVLTEIELMSELVAITSRYIELYVVVSWTLSSQRDSSRGKHMVARVITALGLAHLTLAAYHYLSLDKHNLVHSCSTVWDCEPHLFSFGFSNPHRFQCSYIGWAFLAVNWLTRVGESLFVLHLMKLGLNFTEFSVRRAYVSVFCSASLLWFWSYPVVWLLSSLITEYYQYKFVLVCVSLSHLCAIPAIIRVTVLSPVKIDSTPISVAIYD